MRQGYARSMFGRCRRFWFISEDNRYELEKEALNFPIQSAAHDLLLRALIKLEPMLRGRADALMDGHDSILFEVDRADLRDVAMTMKEVMEDNPEMSLPITAEFETGLSWGQLRTYDPLEVS
jgi:DNA polymerase-1